MPLTQRKNTYFGLFGSWCDAADIEAYVEYLDNQRDCSSDCSDEWYNWADDDDYSAIHIDGESDDEPDEPVIGPIRKGPGKFFNPHVDVPNSSFQKRYLEKGRRFYNESGHINEIDDYEGVGNNLPKRMSCNTGASLRHCSHYRGMKGHHMCLMATYGTRIKVSRNLRKEKYGRHSYIEACS